MRDRCEGDQVPDLYFDILIQINWYMGVVNVMYLHKIVTIITNRNIIRFLQ